MEQLANAINFIFPHDDNDNARQLERSHRAANGGDECNNDDLCRFLNILENCLLWENGYFVTINVFALMLFNALVWLCSFAGETLTEISWMTASGIILHFLIYVLLVKCTLVIVMTVSGEHYFTRECLYHNVANRLRRHLQIDRQKLLHLFLYVTLVTVTLFFRILFYTNKGTTIYWGVMFAAPLLRLPLKISDMISTRLQEADWRNDDIEDEFLPPATEANLQVLDRVGETGDHSSTPTPMSTPMTTPMPMPMPISTPTPTSMSTPVTDALWNDFADPSNDDDLIEGLNIPSHEEVSIDGIESSWTDMELNDNNVEDNDIKFQSGHFQKSSSASSRSSSFSSKEELLNSDKMIAINSDDSDDGSDSIDDEFEIIDLAEIVETGI